MRILTSAGCLRGSGSQAGWSPVCEGRRSKSSGRRSEIKRAVSKLREQHRSRIAGSVIRLLLLATALVFVLVWAQPQPDAHLVRDVFRALAGLASLVGWFYFGRTRSGKRAAQSRELRVEARLHIEQRDRPVSPNAS